ncbi:hypothetical protein, partial [Caballeronia arationis]|uniref:hypothetical protein n=1 Tax=Caballeronia arationis TaxID=1777142 RepID=UPI000A6A847E
MKASEKIRLKAQLATWLVAQLLTLTVTSLLSITLHASGEDVPATAFAIFGALTLVLKSAEFGTVLGLCGQSEHLEGVRV